MFGLSLGKILFTIMIVVVVWKGFGLVSKLAKERDARAVDRQRRQATGAKGRWARWRGQSEAMDLVKCPRCGAYFDPGEGCSCGRKSRG
jgi:hypothetical protein